jgi:nucleoside-diphosphate kinase
MARGAPWPSSAPAAAGSLCVLGVEVPPSSLEVPMTQRTLVLVKPDGVARGLVGEVLGRIERKGLRIVALDLRTIDRVTAEAHYGEHVGKPFFGDLVDFITSGPLVAAVIEGPDAIVQWRAMMGATNPVSAAPGTIRGDLATVMQQNVTHGSDSPESAAREVALFFPDLA